MAVSTPFLKLSYYISSGFSFQHISKFAKHFKDFRQPYTKDETTFRRIAEVIMKYFGRIHTQLKGVETAPTRDTIAILPMYEVSSISQTKVLSSVRAWFVIPNFFSLI